MQLYAFDLSIDIAAPKSRTWEVLADYGNVHKYAKGIVNAYVTSRQSNGVGAVRHCDLPRQMGMKQYLVEEIDDWQEGSSFSYIITDTSAPLNDARVAWRVEGDDRRSKLICHIEYRPSGVLGFLMQKKMFSENQAQMKKGLADIRDSIERIYRSEPAAVASVA